ncbi:MAG: cysteine desulfurase [Deltaproteobacteria bacterium]|nr:cysteine desulfurase [Deltaproteobacteria bacterium]
MSTNPRIYLDFNATAPLLVAARDAMVRAMGVGGNPSSIHADGRGARDLIEKARDKIAVLAGRPREQVVFTSGGTEGNLLGVMGLAALVERRGGPRVVAGARVDHPSLRGPVAALVARGWELRPRRIDSLAGVGLVTASAVNHEVGTCIDIAAWSAAAKKAGALLHVDAVQAAGKLALKSLPADALVISAHKIGGPQGVGALVISADDGLPFVEAGHQERERRPGTENTLGIVGFGAAAATVDVEAWADVAALGEYFEASLIELPGVTINGATAGRIGGTVNAQFDGASGEAVVIALDLAGIAASTGAACTSGSTQPSPVLLALGLTREAALSSVRFSLGRTTTAQEIDSVMAVLPQIVSRARR